MKRKKRILSALMVAVALIIMQLPKAEADASTSASGFQMEGSTLVRYRGTEKNVSVPDTVRVIGQGAFENDTNIELVVLPNSVKRIEAYAFWGCDNLDTVVLGKGLSEVGDYAFTNCTGLEQISIPSTVTSIGTEAFKDCANLKDVTIPPETVNIQESAFDGCYQLAIHYENGSAAEEFAKAFYERQKEMPGYEEKPAPGSLADIVQQVIATPAPEPVPEETPVPAQIPVEEGLVLGVTQIVGNRAVVFLNNTKLQVFGGEGSPSAGGVGTEYVPESGETVPPVQNSADGNGMIPKYRIVDGKIVADQAYYRNAGLGDMTLADGISEIGEFSFARSSLTSIALPPGLERIDYGAFYHCSQLAEMELPDSVLCVEPKAFEHTLWVDSFLAGGTAGNELGSVENESSGEAGDFLITGGVLVAYRGSTAEVTVPEGVRVIAGEAFQNHAEIERVELPDSLLVVGEGAFDRCTGLSEVVFGGNVSEIKDRAFLGNAISEITLPASVKKIGLQAFGNTVVTYEGVEAEYTYETSATKLLNEAYRVYEVAESGEAGVSVVGLEKASASLEGASRNYVLTIEEPESTDKMENAFLRSGQSGLPEDMVLYELTLTDASEIPLTRLGSQKLYVSIPVPEVLREQMLQAVALDRNGQLISLTIEQIALDDASVMYFATNQVTEVGIYGIGVRKDNALVPVAPIEVPAQLPTEKPDKKLIDKEIQDSEILSEYKSALNSAKMYNDTLHMSKEGIYNQLISEYGDKFSTEAAQYAIDNLEADWNANAQKTAQRYCDTMYFSKAKVYDQLVSEYGEKFLPSEAQYAVDNIEVDWNENALKTARRYQDIMNMSPEKIREQLMSEYGEGFTKEEADYAIENL